jgi:lipopolysaccharide/colanic/teichoic acid biosynthesis glycosyltransferase
MAHTIYRRLGKRFLDLAISAPALTVLSPFMLLISLVIRAEDGGPILFRQKRVGAEEIPFTIYKFRSMPVDSAELPSRVAGSLRITRTGAIIRRLNVDELPQLINIVKGDMSVVGPRPALPTQHDLLRLRKECNAMGQRPGLTGLAQINSYDGMDEVNKAFFDSVYCQSITFVTDLRIIIKTFKYLTKRPPTY